MQKYFLFSLFPFTVSYSFTMTCFDVKNIWSNSKCCNDNLDKDLNNADLSTLMDFVHSSGTTSISNGVTCGQIQVLYNDNCGCSIASTEQINQESKASIYTILISSDSPTTSPTAPTAFPTENPTKSPTAPTGMPSTSPSVIPVSFIADKTMLTAAIDKTETDPSFSLQKYGEMSTWDISRVIDMSFAFASWQLFNYNISTWDMGLVTNMDSMFLNTVFNQDISNWNVGAVTNVDSMFEGSSFNQPIGIWDMTESPSRSISAEAMFKDNNAFFQDLTPWIDIVPPNTNELYSSSLMASVGGCDASGPATCPSGVGGGAVFPPISLPLYSIFATGQTVCQQPVAPIGIPWTMPTTITLVQGKTYYQCMQDCTDSSTLCTGFMWGEYLNGGWQTIWTRSQDLSIYGDETLTGHCQLFSGQIGRQYQWFVGNFPGNEASQPLKTLDAWENMVLQNSYWRGSCTVRLYQIQP